MRSLSKDYGISVPSLQEIHRAVGREAERLFDEQGLRIEGGKGIKRSQPQPAHVMNWLACYLLTRPTEERDRILEEGRRILTAHIASDQPVGFGSPDIRPVVSLSDEERQQPRRKGRQGA